MNTQKKDWMRNDYALKSWAWRCPLRPAGWAAKQASKKYPMNGPKHMGEVMRDSDSFILIYCSQREKRTLTGNPIIGENFIKRSMKE